MEGCGWTGLWLTPAFFVIAVEEKCDECGLPHCQLQEVREGTGERGQW